MTPADPSPVQRRLAALLSADVKGYSRLMGEDEVATVRTLNAHREVIGALVGRHRGRIVDFTGDNVLAEFASVVDAVQCAVEIQQGLQRRNAELPAARRMEFRIGINLGDVIVEGERLYGDGVNIAARVEALADPGGVCLSGTVYDQVEGKLPLRLEPLGAQVVKNIARPVRVYRVVTGPPGPDRATPPEPATAVRADRPSIAVLPFANLSADPEQEHLADGMTEEIITTLSKISGMLVIASGSAFRYKSRTATVQELARELGVRHVLEGSIRRAGERVRITAQLVDASTGYQVWAERYERQLTDIFAIQDDIARQIVTALEVTMIEGEQARVRTCGIKSFAAWELSCAGRVRYREMTRDGNAHARELFERACRLEEGSANLLAGLGFTHLQDVRMGWSSDRPASLRRAHELAAEAVRLDESAPDAHALLGMLQFRAGQHDEAVTMAERAVALGPGIADVKVTLAYFLTFVDRSEEAIALVRQAMRESPRCPGLYHLVLGRAYRLAGRYEEALKAHEAHRALEPHSPLVYPGLAIVNMLAGQEAEARQAVAALRAVDPDFTIERFLEGSPYRNPAERERDVDALRRAGLS